MYQLYPWFSGTISSGEIQFYGDRVANNPFIQPKPMNLVSLYRRLTLSEDDRLMIELGLEEPSGVPTYEGLTFANEVLYKENRDKIKEAAKAIKKLEDAKK